jgi:hypothetical protein
MEKKDKLLTPKQYKFAILYAENGGTMSGGMICKKSGYSGTSDQCKRLLDNSSICRVIEAHRNDIRIASGYSKSRMIRELDSIKTVCIADHNYVQALQSLKQITDILHFADKMTTTKQISLNLSFEELLARSKAIDITPTDVGQSSETTSPEILIPDDTGTDLDPAESR